MARSITDTPILLPSPIADGATSSFITTPTAIPINSTGTGWASYFDGFPPKNMLDPITGGGEPNHGQDMNAFLYVLSQALFHQQGGFRYQYNADFSARVGGYPQGAILRSSDGRTEYRSLVNNNTTDPDGGAAANWEVFGGIGMAEQTLNNLGLPIVQAPTSSPPFCVGITPSAVSGTGGTVTIGAGTKFTLGQEVTTGLTAIPRVCTTTSFVSPNLAANSTYFLRAQFVGSTLTFYTQGGALTDTVPASQKGTINGATGGGFYSTPIDICLALIQTGTAGSTPEVRKVMNAPEYWSFSRVVSGTSHVNMPIDPFVKKSELEIGIIAPNGAALCNVTHGSTGWDGYSGITRQFNAGAITSDGTSVSWVSAAPALLTTAADIGDAEIVRASLIFDHVNLAMGQISDQREHNVGDSSAAFFDEQSFFFGSKSLNSTDYTTGLRINYSNCLSVPIYYKIFR